MRRRERDIFVIGEERMLDEVELGLDGGAGELDLVADAEDRSWEPEPTAALESADIEGGRGEPSDGRSERSQRPLWVTPARILALGALALGAVLSAVVLIGGGEPTREGRPSVAAREPSSGPGSAAEARRGMADATEPDRVVRRSGGSRTQGEESAPERAVDREGTDDDRGRSASTPSVEPAPEDEAAPESSGALAPAVPPAAAPEPPQPTPVAPEPEPVPAEEAQSSDFSFGTPVAEGSE